VATAAAGNGDDASAVTTGRAADGIREIRRILQNAQRPPRWPMYVRQLKQYLRAVEATFDERKYGFETLGDLMRACQRDGLLRIERDRQGGMRIFPGNLPPAGAPSMPSNEEEEADDQQAMGLGEPTRASESFDPAWASPTDDGNAAEVVEGAVVREVEVPQIVDAEEAPAAAEKPSRRRPRAAKGAKPSGESRSRKTGDGPAKARKPAAKPRAARGRSRPEASSQE